MTQSLQEATATLQAAGLAVSIAATDSLQIGSSLDDVGNGIHIFRNGCAIHPRHGEWVVLFPADGIQQYEIPGTLADGVALVLSAYAEHRQHGGRFRDACKRVLKGADPHPLGRSLAAV